MFFMAGVTQDRKELDYDRMVICEACGRYGHLRVFMTCMVLSIFFIPVFRWNRQYFVEMSCCGSIYTLDPEKGRQIERGISCEIEQADLVRVGAGTPGAGVLHCPDCGYTTNEDFQYCPRCGRKLVR